MPTAQQIRESLEHATNDWAAVAIGWHIAAVIAVIAVLAHWRPSNRLAGALLPLPLLSVSIISALEASPFNAAVPGALALALIGLSLRLDRQPVRLAGGGPAAIGALLVAFGLAYPHFLTANSPIAYLYAAPTGVIPCPTLSLVTGAALLAGGLQSRAYSVTLASAGLFYGAFGALVLHVWIDFILAAGAVLLLFTAWRGRWGRSMQVELARPLSRGSLATGKTMTPTGFEPVLPP